MEGESLSDDSFRSAESVTAEEILQTIVEDGELTYLCRTTDGTDEIFDRSDLMDDGAQQRLVLRWEKTHPPPWDPICTYCEGEGCEECVCEECGRACRHINGTNYGCALHPVV